MDKDRVGPALGRVTSGLYIATTRVDDEPIGMLCSFVEQASFHPPMITIAMAPDRRLARALMLDPETTPPEIEPPLVGLNVLSTENHGLIGPFANPNNEDPFVNLSLVSNDFGLPQLRDALAFLVCRFRREMPAGDHHVYLFEVLDGQLVDGDLEPMIRVRRNGFSY